MTILIEVIFILNILFFIWQIYLNNKYKPYKNYVKYYPKLSIIVPAFNEGICVKHTIKSIMKSKYPKNRYELIVVNDGSTDDTDQIIQDTIKNIKNIKIKYLNLPKNKGKRNAIYQAAINSFGEYLITVDSDSIITPYTIQNLIAPFIKDKNIGGVAGNILVANKDKFIPKLLSSAFIFGFKFLRPAQSRLNCVLCTPGALSAYRKSVILPELCHWKHALFFGHRSNIGEDRALTTIILKKNYKVVYQDNAICYTNVPESYKNLVKMFIRWIRGDIRESFSVFWFLKNIKKEKQVFNYIGLILQLSMQLLWMFTPFLLLYYIFQCICNPLITPMVILSSLVMTLFWSILPAYICFKNKGLSYSIYSIIYGILNVFTLFWIIPYSWFTIGKSGWLTRK